MQEKLEYKALCNLWEKMQTTNKPEQIAARACVIISDYMQKNENISADMLPFIEFFEHANNVLNTKNFQTTNQPTNRG